jgi:hypothetical protein
LLGRRNRVAGGAFIDQASSDVAWNSEARHLMVQDEFVHFVEAGVHPPRHLVREPSVVLVHEFAVMAHERPEVKSVADAFEVAARSGPPAIPSEEIFHTQLDLALDRLGCRVQVVDA